LLELPRRSRPELARKQADRLGELLGEEHDLVVLSGTVEREAGSTSPTAAWGLNLAIGDRYDRLCAKALRLGARTYARRPKEAVAGGARPRSSRPKPEASAPNVTLRPARSP
jgi:hypothetical protein